jgi:HEAT repeat protein
MGAEICFDSYLRSLVRNDERLQDSYAQTDATDLFDFGLMAQTVQEQKERQKGQETQDSEQEKSKIETFPVLDGIRKYASEKVLLVGKPGSGKSTALQKLLVDESQKVLDGQASLIPVLIELRSWRTSYTALIKDFFRVHKLRLNEETIDDLLFDGKLLLLVDGVNELPADYLARQDIMTLRETNPDTPMIFTTRVLGVGGDLGIEKKLEMLPLSDSQMRQFVQIRLPEQGNQMLQQLGDRLRKFGDTPLLLSMLCDVFKINGRVPANLGSAFRDFANLYDGKLKEHIPVSEHSRSWWSKLLPQLAFAMMPQDRPDGLRLSIPRSEAVDILAQFLDREKFDKPRDYAQQWLKDLLKYHLIQVKLVGTNEEIEFRHQLIQEYYAAEYLLPLFPNLTDIKFQHSYLNYLDWTESLALMLELVEGEEQAVRVVRLALAVDLRLGARLAGAVRYGFQEKTVGLLMKEIDEREIPKLYAIKLLGETRSDVAINLVILNLGYIEPYMCWEAVEAFVNIGSDKVVDSLVHALKDTNSYMRCEAASALGEIRSDKSIKILSDALKDEDVYVRRNVADALGKIASDKTIEPLCNALKDEDVDVRRNVADALGKIISDKAIKPLCNALSDIDYYVHKNASEALVNIDINIAIEALSHAAKHQDFVVRWNATGSLGNISSDKVIKPLIHSLNDEDFGVRRNAVQSLGKIDSNQVIDPLIYALKDTNPDVRKKAVKILSKADSNIDRIVETLICTFEDENVDVRREVIKALENISGNKAFETLVHALEDEDIYVRRNAVKALQNIGSDEAVAAITKALKDQDCNVRWDSETALIMIKNESATEAIFPNLENVDSYMRWKAVEELGKISGDKAVEELIHYLTTDIDECVRRRAASELGKICSDKAVEALIHALTTDNFSVRLEAAEALVKISSDRVINALCHILKDKDSCARREVVGILVKIANEDAVEALGSALTNKDFYTRSNAAQALVKIGNDQAVKALSSALKSKNLNTRGNAAQALVEIDNDKAIEALFSAFKDEDNDISCNAKWALEKIENDKVVICLIDALTEENSDIRYKASDALGNICNDKAIKPLIITLEDLDSNVSWSAAESLKDFIKADRNLPTLTQQLPHLLTLIPTESSQQALSVITAIQARCKYYNYKIAQTPLPPEDNPNPTIGNTYIFKAPVDKVVAGNLIVHGNNIATQNNQKTAPES